MVQLLAHKGADLNLQYKGSDTPLKLAVRARRSSIVEMLLRMGADVDHGDKDFGTTALLNACMDGYFDIALLFLRYGANVNRGSVGRTPRMHRGYSDSLGLFTGQMGLESSVEDYAAGLLRRAARPVRKLALCCRHMEPAFTAMIHDGDIADGISEHKQPTNPLWALIRGLLQHENKILYDKPKNLDPDLFGGPNVVGGQTLLMLAAKHGNTEAAKLFIDHGAFIDLPDRCGWTALMYAAWHGHRDVILILLDEGAAINRLTKDGRTALVLAIQAKREEVVALLRDRGAAGEEGDRGQYVMCPHWMKREEQLEKSTLREQISMNFMVPNP